VLAHGRIFGRVLCQRRSYRVPLFFADFHLGQVGRTDLVFINVAEDKIDIRTHADFENDSGKEVKPFIYVRRTRLDLAGRYRPFRINKRGRIVWICFCLMSARSSSGRCNSPRAHRCACLAQVSTFICGLTTNLGINDRTDITKLAYIGRSILARWFHAVIPLNGIVFRIINGHVIIGRKICVDPLRYVQCLRCVLGHSRPSGPYRSPSRCRFAWGHELPLQAGFLR
jgi:hypothetical protein